MQKTALFTAIWMTTAATLLPTHAADAGKVKLEKGEDTVTVTIGGREFTKYNFNAELPKPFFWPVRGGDGTILTRDIIYDRTKGDHPHHKGIWVAVDEIGGVKFWAEHGKIANRSVELTVPAGNPAKLTVVNDWQNEEGKTVVTETSVISIHENGLFAFDIRFTNPGDAPVDFGDTKEGLLGFRMVHSMQESEGGQVVNAEGLKGTKACWGKPSAWIDYVGPVDKGTFGVALFDHPLNMRPSRYHVRNYGLFSISPFGQKAYTGGKLPAQPYFLFPDGELRLRYGLYIHDGDTKSADVSGVHLNYLKSGL